MFGEGSKHFWFVLINTQEVVPGLAVTGDLSPDSLSSPLSANTFQTAWDVEIILEQLISQAEILHTAHRPCIHSPEKCTRIQHLDHSCIIKEHSINHRCRLWVSAISLYAVFKRSAVVPSHIFSPWEKDGAAAWFLKWFRLPSCVWQGTYQTC